MALLNIFRKKPSKIEEQVSKPQPKAGPPGAGKPKRILGEAYRVLKRPHVTEKATDLVSKNQYIFEIYPGINKNQVKKAVEDVYGVDVVEVNIINIPKKRRRLGRIEGWKKGYKKAVVKIKGGQKIELLSR